MTSSFLSSLSFLVFFRWPYLSSLTLLLLLLVSYFLCYLILLTPDLLSSSKHSPLLVTLPFSLISCVLCLCVFYISGLTLKNYMYYMLNWKHCRFHNTWTTTHLFGNPLFWPPLDFHHCQSPCHYFPFSPPATIPSSPPLSGFALMSRLSLLYTPFTVSLSQFPSSSSLPLFPVAQPFPLFLLFHIPPPPPPH